MNDLLLSPILFAQAQRAEQLVVNTRDTVGLVRESFDQLWNTILTGSLYDALADLAIALALLFVGWNVVKVVVLESGGGQFYSQRYLPDLIWAVILSLLLASPSGVPNLAGYTLEARSLINNSSTYILDALSDDLAFPDGSDVVVQAQIKSQAQLLVSDALRSCAAIADGPQRTVCLENARLQMDDMLTPYYGFRGTGNWAQELYLQLTSNIQDAMNRRYASAAFWHSLFRDLGAIVRPATTLATVGILYAWAGAFEWLLEMALLLTAIIGPLFLGLSMIPTASRYFYLWVTGIGSIALGKVGFNIVTGLAGYIIVSTPNSNPLVGALFIAIAAPLLALALIGGGGLGIYTGLVSTATVLGSRTARG
ncbi:MAG: hypothetical protein AAGA95_10940 [Pseudomonadota bacterium]